MALDRRQRTYFAVRAAAAGVFIVAAGILPRGVPAALLCVAAGLVAVMTSFSTNAGGPGERAGARPQDRAFERMRAPQGDWPPYRTEPVAADEPVVRQPVPPPD